MADSFESFVDENYQGAYRFALSLCRDHHEACDLTQQAFYIAQTRSHQLRDAGKRKQWLFTILHREFLRTVRRETTRHAHDVELNASETTQISEDHAANMDAKTLLTILQSMEEHFRVPITLFYIEQISYKEISQILNVPIGTVMSRLSRGKQVLRQLLTAASEADDEKVIPIIEPKSGGHGG